MDEKTRAELKSLLVVASVNNSNFRGTMGLPPSPIIGGIPPVPIPISPALAPYLYAIRQHAEDFDRLIKVLDRVIDQI